MAQKCEVIEVRKLKGNRLEKILNEVMYTGKVYVVKKRREHLVKLVPLIGHEKIAKPKRPAA